MSTTINPSIQSPIQSSSQMGFMAPTQITDFLISNMIMSKFSDVMKNDFVLSFKNIGKLLLLLSANELKTGLNELFSCFIKFVKEFPQIALQIIMYVTRFFNSHLKHEVNIVNHIKERSSPNVLQIEADQYFMNALCLYIIKTKTCSFNETICNVVIKNTKENMIIKNLTNSIIEMENYKLQIIDSIYYELNIHTNEISCTNYHFSQNITQYCDLLTIDQRNVIRGIYSQMQSNAILSHETIHKYFESLGLTMFPKEVFSEWTIADLIIGKYKNLDKIETLHQICIYGSIIYGIFGRACIFDAFNDLKERKIMKFDKSSEYLYANDVHVQSCTNKIYARIIQCAIEINFTRDQLKTVFVDYLTQFNTAIKKEGNLNKNKNINMIILSELPQNEQHVITDFIKIIYGSYNKNTTKTKINYLQLEDDITTTEKTNPEYDEWKQKKELIDKLKSVQDSQDEIMKFINQPIPLAKITTQIIKKKVMLKQLNEIEKDFSTLYLRKHDKEKLIASLDMFKNKGHILQEMGLQNKFNLLLYGEPGTGKSTTIQAVANYLQKDIYYVDLQKAELNDDLQLIFEYVNKNIPNHGGLIVIEDIDVMTTVVHKRSINVNEYKVSDLVANTKSKLSLEYLLNILQGTLTLDNSVFIVTTNKLDHLDPAFYRNGRFDVKIELKLCDHYQINAIYNRMIGRMIPDELLRKIPENKFTPATIIFHIKNYIFNKEVTDDEILAPFV